MTPCLGCSDDKDRNIPKKTSRTMTQVVRSIHKPAYSLNDKEIKQTIFDYLWKYCYIYSNDDCACEFRRRTITAKSRFGKKFDMRLIKYLEIFGFTTTSGPLFDATILPESQQKFDEMKQLINMKLTSS